MKKLKKIKKFKDITGIKELKGINVQSLAADPTAVEGEVWYNSTSATLKVAIDTGSVVAQTITTS